MKIASLAATATFSADASNLTRAGKANNLVSMFASDAQIILDASSGGGHTFSGSDEIRAAAIGGFGSLPSLKVEFLDATAKVSPDQQNAEVNCTAKISAGASKDFGVQEIRFQLKKTDGSWLITRVETVKTLQ